MFDEEFNLTVVKTFRAYFSALEKKVFVDIFPPLSDRQGNLRQGTPTEPDTDDPELLRAIQAQERHDESGIVMGAAMTNNPVEKTGPRTVSRSDAPVTQADGRRTAVAARTDIPKEREVREGAASIPSDTECSNCTWDGLEKECKTEISGNSKR